MGDELFSSQISEKELRRSYWFITHIPTFKRVGFFLLIGVDVLLWLIVIGTLLNFYAIQYSGYKNIFRGYSQLTSKDLGAISRAQDIQVRQIGSLANNSTSHDLYAEVTNPNSLWRAEFTYTFLVNGGELREQRGFIMPGESKFLMLLSLDGDAPRSGVELRFKNLKWYRVSVNDQQYLKDHLKFSVQDFRFISAQESGISQTVPISRATFTLVNNTGYSYRSVGLPIALFDGGQVVGVTYITTDNILPGEKRSLEARWFQSIGLVGNSTITPSVNVFDTSVFRPVQGVKVQDIRNGE